MPGRETKRSIPPGTGAGVVFAAALATLVIASRYSYLLFHSLSEMFTIIIAFGIFIVTWNSRRYHNNNYLLFIGISSVFVGVVDLLHLLAYKGMGVFPDYDANLATQLWVVLRYLTATSFLLAPFFFGRKFDYPLVFGFFTVIVGGALVAIFAGVFPVAYIEGSGLTTFKIYSEYIISLIFAAALVVLLVYRTEFDRSVWRLLAAAYAVSIAQELAFTLYSDVYGIFNLTGHVLEIIAYYLVYKAIIETGLSRPYDLLFRRLKQREETLETALAKEQQARQSLATSEGRFRAVAETAVDAIVTIDEQGKVVLWSGGAEAMFGYTAAEMMGNPLDVIIPERLRTKHQRGVARFFAGDSPAMIGRVGERAGAHGIEQIGLRKDGREVPLELTMATWQAGEARFVTAMLRDITERKKAEEQLRTYERLATLGQVAGSISHEIRNPLAIIGTSIFFLENRLKDADEKVKQHLKRIHDSIQRSTSIIQSLLNLTQMKEPGFQDVDLKALATESVAELAAVTTLEVVRQFPEGPVLVRADDEQLRMVFRNLVTNAVQSMNNQGTLTVRLVKNGDKAELSIADTGPGITPENMGRLFQPFFSTKARGIGFGLSIAKMVVEKHGGSIEARSTPGAGATFTVRLPLRQELPEVNS